ncbi:hypothetical protein SELMODRAFT_431514 [Selaginella moellendorffii]|uniref:Uncharacterized protein n=1 Tax=Selaginella moellendorffii TaxID=88036 RepID=D8TCX1_SELML|nr:hypothetical protein SELMODRAFT_431514 [Selaginella moellendorffii]
MNDSFLSTSSKEQGEEEDGAASSGYYPPVILKELHQKLWKSEGVKIVNISVEGLSQATILCSTNSVTKSVSMKLRWVRLLVWSVGYIDSVGVNFQSPRLRQQASDHSRPALGTLLDEITAAEVAFVLDLAMSADWHQLSSVTAMDVYKSTPDLTKSQELQRLGHRWRKVSFLYRFFVFTIFAEKIIGDDPDKEKRRLIVCSTSKHDLERVLASAEYGLMNRLSEIYRAFQGAGPREWLAALYSAGVPCAVASTMDQISLLDALIRMGLDKSEAVRHVVHGFNTIVVESRQLSQKRMEWTPPRIGSWILCPGDQSGRELDPLSQRLEWPRDGMVKARVYAECGGGNTSQPSTPLCSITGPQRS